MRFGHLGWIAFALLLTLSGCGDDDDDSTAADDNPFGNAAGSSALAGSRSPSGSGGRVSDDDGASAGTGVSTGGNAGPEMPGAGMPDGGMMKPPMMPMVMCPDTMPMDGSACMGHGGCMFGNVECHCRMDSWSCEEREMVPDEEEDGGTML